MRVDIIILSNGKTPELRAMTQQTIDSCHKSESAIEFDILVFEQTKDIEYFDCTTVHYDDDFHYNRLMNRGIEMTKNPYVCLCNNDLLFGHGWAEKCIRAMDEGGYLSVSPNSVPYPVESIREGYGIALEVKGWCIFTDRKLYDTIGKIDESVSFWFSDNVYADQLKKHDIKHALVRHAFVKHLDGMTLNTVTPEYHRFLTEEQEEIYKKIK